MSMSSTVKLVLNVDDQNASTTLKTIQNNVVGLGGAIVGLGASTKVITGLTKSAVDLGLSFEQSFAKVSTLFGDVAVDTDNLKSKILELSSATGIASTELNEGLYSALSAGIPVTEDMSEALGFLEQASMLATAGFTTTEKAVDVATTVLNAYGLEVGETDRVMNTLIETQNAGKTTVDELASSLGKVIPTASTLGVNFEELSASVAILTANGIGTAETMTKLKALFVELNDPASDINKLFMEIAGETFPNFIKNGGNLESGLHMLKDELDKNNESWGEYLSSVEAVDAATILMKDNGESLRTTYDRMTDDTYELASAYETMQTPAQQISKITEGFNNALIDMGTTILDTVSPALDFLADNIDTVAPLVLDLALAVSGLVFVLSAVKVVKTFSSGIKLLGTEAKGTTKSIVSLGTSVVTKLATPWGLALTGMSLVAFAFRDDLAVVMKDVTESIVNMATDSTEAQRDFRKDVEEINKGLGESLVAITEEYSKKVEDGEMTSAEARVKIAEESTKLRLDAEKDYNERYAQLQDERYAEEEVALAKSSGKKKELMDSSEKKLLELRKQYDDKMNKLNEAQDAYESAEDEESKTEALNRLEKLNDDLFKIEADAGEELLVLKAGNRAKDDDDFLSYTDSTKAKIADMTNSEKEAYEERANAGESFRNGEYTAVVKAYDQMVETVRTKNGEMVEIETKTGGKMVATVTDSMGEQLEVTRNGKGEIESVITDANGGIVEGTKEHQAMLERLETENWTDLLTIAGGGSEDMQKSIDNMWDGILASADNSNKSLRNKAVRSGEELAQQWLDNGNISVEEYDSMIQELDDVTQKAVDDAKKVDPVEVEFAKEQFKLAMATVPKETRDAITKSNAMEDITVGSLYKMRNSIRDVVDYNPESVIVPVSYSGGTVPDVGTGPLPQHAKGGIVSGTEIAMIGEGGPELVLPLNMQGAQFLQQLMPNGGGGGGGNTYVEIGQINGMKDAYNVADEIDKTLGKRVRKR